MNKKDSIFFQIKIFFFAIFLIINLLIILQFIIDTNAYKILEIKRYTSSIKILEDLNRNHASKEEINEKISIFDMRLSDISLEELLNSNYEKITVDKEAPVDLYKLNNIKYVHFNPKFEHFNGKMPPPPKPPKGEEMFNKFEESIFFKLRPKPFEILLIDELDEKQFKYFWLLILFLIDSLLIWFYLFIKKKLIPLHNLKKHMIELSKGNFKISTKTKEKDEISQVANEFDNAITQLRQLRESRNLFLRNIMHELKTPITKGKLATDLINEDENKYILMRVFHRLEYLIGEFAKVEELTSGKLQLDRKKFHAIDLIEQAFDILLIDNENIDLIDNDDLIFDVDFELFSIALKNLIDNAIKYNKNGNPQIFIYKDYIEIRNKGDKLKKEIFEYYRPFNHEYETANDGLGLGLYITNNIVKIHDLKLNYKYVNGFHSFIINVN